MRLKKGIDKDLIFVIQKSKIFTGIKFRKFREIIAF